MSAALDRVQRSAASSIQAIPHGERASGDSHATAKCLALLALITVAFYWKFVLTHQYSLLTEAEGVNQGYSWYHYWVSTIRQGFLPLWDPYTFAGHSFAGEMQTGTFYPVKLLLALVPLNKNGVLSPAVFHLFFAFGHFLASLFMFALVRELGRSRIAALLAGICFSFGGFILRMGWPHQLEASIWLPIIVLFLLRAMRSERLKTAVFLASIAGLALGMTILAGGLHLAIMQSIVIATLPLLARGAGSNGWRDIPRVRAALLSAVTLAVGLAAGAVQLLPSAEYSTHAIRFLGISLVPSLPASQKIPYAALSDGLWPHSFVLYLIPTAFGPIGTGEITNPYLGVFPLLLAVIGVWRNWREPIVRYLAAVVVLVFLYTLGGYSWIHGLLYAIVPFLWMAREAGRFVYLAGFAMPILAAFGLDTLFGEPKAAHWEPLRRILGWVVIACLAVLFVSAIYAQPPLNPWMSFSLVMIIAAYGLFRFITSGNTGPWVRVVLILFVLFDLHAFDWNARNRLLTAKSGTDHLEQIMTFRGAAAFLRSRPGPFRIQLLIDTQPNVGDLFEVQTTGGAGATLMTGFTRVMGSSNLLNVRYFVRPASAGEPNPVYADAYWKVYENPQAYPRAWIVHRAVVEPDAEKLQRQLADSSFDSRHTALIGAPLAAALDPAPDGAAEDTRVTAYEPNRMELQARAAGRGLVVLSEMFYPGWRAEVDGRAAPIHKVDGALRGIEVPAGTHRITLRYAPVSVYAGAAMTLLAFLGVSLSAVFVRRTASE